jgi:hypothetical protein
MIDSRRIGQVQSIWKPANKEASRSLLLVKKSNQNRVIPFYGMREIVIQEDLVWIKATVRFFALNLFYRWLIAFLYM